jgi:protein TonB
MLSIAILMVAAASSSPALAMELTSGEDYPAEAHQSGTEGTAIAKLLINKRGRVAECEIVESSGHASLDHATCVSLRKRARFKPARDSAGKVIEATYITPPIRWRIPR